MKNFLLAIVRGWLRIVLMLSPLVFVEQGQGQIFTPYAEQSSALAVATSPGQSSTLLPDGSFLLIGGEQNGVTIAAIELIDRTTGIATINVTPLPTPRQGHSATVLPDGRVLILGGFGPDHTIVNEALAFDPVTGTVATIAIGGFTARAEHTATLLTDGRVLIAGGIGEDGALC